MPLKKLTPNLILLFTTLLFIGFSLEVALHIINPEKPKRIEKPKTDWALVPERVWTEHHSKLGWTLQKNKDAVLKIDNGTFRMKFNSYGARGVDEYPFDRSPNIKRMVLIGDSFPFGWGVEDSEVLSEKLKSRNPGLEFINLSVPGYGIDQIYLSYSEFGRRFSPDIVFIAVYPEDFWRATRAFSDTGHAKPYFFLRSNGTLELKNTPVPAPFTLKTNQFPAIVEKSPLQNFLSQSYIYRFLQKRCQKLGKSLGLIDPNTTDEWKLGKAILRDLLKTVRDSGAQPVLFTAPPERWALETSDESLLEALHRFAKEDGVLFLDFTPEFRKLAQTEKISDYYIPEDRHWTAKSHDYVSRRLAEILSQSGYVLN